MAKAAVGQIFTVAQIKQVCARGHMGLELSFVPLGNRTPINGTGIMQMWETVSEGSPISPVVATAEELADWLGTNRAEDATRDQWFAMITAGGWAPSLVMRDGCVMSGVEAVAQEGV